MMYSRSSRSKNSSHRVAPVELTWKQSGGGKETLVVKVKSNEIQDRFIAYCFRNIRPQCIIVRVPASYPSVEIDVE